MTMNMTASELNASSSEPHVVLEAVSKEYDGKRVVDSLSLEVDRGEFITLLGPSGCGKTTTLRILAGFASPSDGQVMFGGRVVSTPEWSLPPERRDIGMVFQNYAVWPHRNVFDNVAYGLRLRNLSSQEVTDKVTAVCSNLGLESFLERYPHELSGGQQQRVALARSLVTEPSVLLLDEPLSNLDAQLRIGLRVELRAVQRRTGITFIYVTHDQAEALSLSHRVAVLRDGTLQQYADPFTLYQRPANMFVASFIGHVNSIQGTVVLRDTHPKLDVGDGGLLNLTGEYREAEGRAVTICVRPESIHLVDSDKTSSAVATQILDRDFLGDRVIYRLDLSGQELLVLAPPVPLHELGSIVDINIPPDSLIDFGT